MIKRSDNETKETGLRRKLADRKPFRKTIETDDIAGVDLEKLVLQVLRNSEQNEALALAYTLRDRAAKVQPALASDDKFFEGLRIVAHLFVACRDAAEPDAYPAFVSPEWMQEKLHPHELQTLLNRYNAYVGEVFPGGADTLVEPHKLVALLDLCAEHEHDDIPNAALARFSHEVLVEVVIRAAVLLRDAKNDAVEMRARLDVLASAGVVYDEERGAVVDGTISNYAVRLMAEEPRNDVLAAAAERVRTQRDAELVMAMLGWKEGTPSWRRVLGEESGGKAV
jgi:hypothetical protein